MIYLSSIAYTQNKPIAGLQIMYVHVMGTFASYVGTPFPCVPAPLHH